MNVEIEQLNSLGPTKVCDDQGDGSSRAFYQCSSTGSVSPLV